MRGARYLAEERGAFERIEAPALLVVEAPVMPAQAPLYEVAALHDGQPAREWLQFFMRSWNAGVSPEE